MNTRTLANYRTARSIGERAAAALLMARIVEQFRRAEWSDLVRIRTEEDTDQYDAGDCLDGMSEEARGRFWDRINHLGVWGVIGEYRLSPDAPWIVADSIWGCAGYCNPADWRENSYVPDIMAQTLDALKNDLRSRCVTCRAAARRSNQLQAVAA